MKLKELQELYFEDVSPDKNGLAYRLDLSGGLMELCVYLNEGIMRLQTKRSGVTIPLYGVKSINDVRDFYSQITGTYPKTRTLKTEAV